MSDYTKHKNKERMNRYTLRHKKNENWGKSGIKQQDFGANGYCGTNQLYWEARETSLRNLMFRFDLDGPRK